MTETATDFERLCCPNCGSEALKAWYLEPMGYSAEVTRDELGVHVETFSEGQGTDGGELDDFSCQECGAAAIKEDDLVPAKAHRCQGCGRWWDDGDLREAKDLTQRVAPGEPMPSGECPDCGALCQPRGEA